VVWVIHGILIASAASFLVLAAVDLFSRRGKRLPPPVLERLRAGASGRPGATP
jgi:hypothetical protein